jgi:hypothetical protein
MTSTSTATSSEFRPLSLQVFPGTTHFFGLARTALVLEVVLSFLDAPLPGS